MRIESVFSAAFRPYGQVLEGYDFSELIAAMNAIPLPESGTAYRPGIPSLETCAVFAELRDRGYGGMPIQLGMCWGRNTRLNCLEYHRDSEINVAAEDMILLLARQEEITDGILDTACVKAFLVPAGTGVEVYATTLHYAPCHMRSARGFRSAVALPLGTNTEKPAFVPRGAEDRRMTARNKWLLAHPDTDEAKTGAYIGLRGENLDVSALIEG